MARARGVRAARLQAIKADITSNLVDETLAMATVAARHGVTPRYVHKSNRFVLFCSHSAPTPSRGHQDRRSAVRPACVVDP